MIFFLTACAGVLLVVEYYFFAQAYQDMIAYKKTYQHLIEEYKTSQENNQEQRNQHSDQHVQVVEATPFRLPIEQSNFWLSSQFGPRKKRNGSWGYHYGIDMASPKGTAVKAAASGVIIEAAYSKKGYGKTIVIHHDDDIYQTRYAHLDEIFVRVGQHIKTGQRIGLVGATGFVLGERGNKNASHLHFEVKKQGKHIDPLSILA